MPSRFESEVIVRFTKLTAVVASALTAALLSFGAAVPAAVANGPLTFTSGLFAYEDLGNGTVAVTGFADSPAAAAVIPAEVEYDGLTYSVVQVAPSAFFGKDLSTVRLPSSLMSIGANAFESNLITEVTIPDSVSFIGDSAFAFNSSITSVTLGSGLDTIGNSAFAQSTLSSLVVPAGVIVVGMSSFSFAPNATVTMLGNSPVIEPGYLAEASFGGTPLLLYPRSASGYTYPTWNGYNTDPYATLTFAMNGHGIEPAVQRLRGTDVTTEPSTPTANGYRFTGWFADPELEIPFDFGRTLTHDVTAYAGWEEIIPVPAVSPSLQQLTGRVGTPVVPTQPLQTVDIAGTVTYTIDPALPAGLSIDAASGVVSGTPTFALVATFTVTATGSVSGQASAQIEVSISSSPLPPTNAQATVLGDQVLVTWEPGSSAEGAQYGVWNTNEDGGAACTTTNTWCYISGLLLGESYSFAVRASTSASPAWSEFAYANPVTVGAVAPVAAADLPESSSAGVSLLLTSTAGAQISSAQPGQTVTVSGQGFIPNSTVYLYAYSTPQLLTQVTVSPLGGFTQSVTLPSNLAAGSHHLVAQGFSSQGQVALGIASLTVAGATGGNTATSVTTETTSKTLANTGGQIPWGALGVAGVALLAGLGVRLRVRHTDSSR